MYLQGSSNNPGYSDHLPKMIQSLRQIKKGMAIRNSHLKFTFNFMIDASHCTLALADNKTTFLPGHVVQGQLSLLLAAPTPLLLVRARFLGRITTYAAHVKTSVVFRETEVFLDTLVVLEEREHVLGLNFRYLGLI